MPRKKRSAQAAGDYLWMLEDLASLLDDHAKGKPLPRFQAAQYSEICRRIARPPVNGLSEAKHVEFAKALEYAIRRKLSGESKWKWALKKTAHDCGVDESVLRTYAGDYAKQVRARLDRLMWDAGKWDSLRKVLVMDEPKKKWLLRVALRSLQRARAEASVKEII